MRFSAIYRSKVLLARAGVIALVSALVACADLPTAAEPPAPVPPPAGKRVLGQITIRFNVTGPGEVRPSIVNPGVVLPSNVRGTVTITSEGGFSSIQGEFLPGAGSFTVGAAGSGYRYLFGTMKVRNAGTNGSTMQAYSTPRPNLTLIATATSMPGAVAGTPFASLQKYDGTAANQSIASGILPTGASLQTLTGTVTAHTPDVFMVFTEGEIAALGSDVFPYGYVVRHKTSTTSRTLAANPAPDQFDGFITFGLKIPLQSSPADDVYGFSMSFNAVDDSETKVTQSMEEQDATAQAAFEARAAALTGITEVRVLEGGNYTGSLPIRYMCSVRIAGSAGSPTQTLENTSVTGSFSSWTPNPFAAGGPTFLARTGTVTATFTAARTGASATTFVVNGSHSGREFLSSGTYTGNGSTALVTPAGNYFAGEEVLVSLTPRFGCPGRVTRFRVASSSSAGTLGTNTDIAAGNTPLAVTAGDFDNDGDLDFAVVNSGANTVSVFLNSGSGTSFTAATVSVLTSPAGVAAGDIDADGDLDLIVAINGPDNNLSVLRNNGSGAFTVISSAAIGGDAGPNAVALADVDADGRLDVIFTNGGSTKVSVALGVGNGTFYPKTNYTIGAEGSSVALADVDADGRLDIITTNENTNNVSVLKGTATGFGAKNDFAVGTAPNAAAFGDVDGDGDIDMVTANPGTIPGTDDIRVSLNNGSGSFGTATALAGTNNLAPFGVALVDMNGDGKLDIVAANAAGNSVSVLLGNGSGSFTAVTGSPFTTGTAPSALALADLNNDGKLDVVTANQFGNNASVLLQP